MIGSVNVEINYFVSFKAASLDYAFLVFIVNKKDIILNG